MVNRVLRWRTGCDNDQMATSGRKYRKEIEDTKSDTASNNAEEREAEMSVDKRLVARTFLAGKPLTRGTLTIICSSIGHTKGIAFYRICLGILAHVRTHVRTHASPRGSLLFLRRFDTRL
jgi:hypothetical protein